MKYFKKIKYVPRKTEAEWENFILKKNDNNSKLEP